MELKHANMNQRIFWMITLSNFSQWLFYRAKSEETVDCWGYSQGKCTLKLNSSAHEKYEYGYLGCWYIKLTLFKRF